MNNVVAVCLATMLLLTGCLSPDEDETTVVIDESNVTEKSYEGDEVGECEDDADNDRDGLFDCNDSDCKGSKVCPEEIAGCTYVFADNYVSNATKNDGTCLFEEFISNLENASYDEGYQKGVDEGESEGYSLGYNSGYDTGYDTGYAAGNQDFQSSAYNEGYEVGFIEGTNTYEITQSTLDVIHERGSLKCGIKTSQFGMGYLADDGSRSGLDIEYCRAVAAAIGLDPDTEITYVLATGSNRFDLLAAGDIDVLIRTTTWTTSRDADLNADFAGINFYDGQGMLVNTDSHPGATSVMDLDGATVCVGIGTTTEGNLADYFQVNSLTYTAVNSADAAAAKASFTDQSCTAWTGDMSAMVAQKWGLEQSNDGAGPGFSMAIMSETMSKEPLAAATRDNDDDWNDVVTWVWYGMLTAEELGVDSTNYASQNLSNPAYNRLLNSSLGLGTETNPLNETWMQHVLATTGNYAEAYDRSFCDGTGSFENCLLERAGTKNAPYWEGGLQYAPPMR